MEKSGGRKTLTSRWRRKREGKKTTTEEGNCTPYRILCPICTDIVVAKCHNYRCTQKNVSVNNIFSDTRCKIDINIITIRVIWVIVSTSARATIIFGNFEFTKIRFFVFGVPVLGKTKMYHYLWIRTPTHVHGIGFIVVGRFVWRTSWMLPMLLFLIDFSFFLL